MATEVYGPGIGGQLTNAMNRYETVDEAALTYDPRGNTLTDTLNSYAYDVLNRQTMVTNTTGITTEYVYDARGRRVAKVTAGITVTHYLYDTQYHVSRLWPLPISPNCFPYEFIFFRYFTRTFY